MVSRPAKKRAFAIDVMENASTGCVMHVCVFFLFLFSLHPPGSALPQCNAGASPVSSSAPRLSSTFVRTLFPLPSLPPSSHFLPGIGDAQCHLNNYEILQQCCVCRCRRCYLSLGFLCPLGGGGLGWEVMWYVSVTRVFRTRWGNECMGMCDVFVVLRVEFVKVEVMNLRKRY